MDLNTELATLLNPQTGIARGINREDVTTERLVRIKPSELRRAHCAMARAAAELHRRAPPRTMVAADIFSR